MTQQIVTAAFDSRPDADKAIARLVQAGIPRGQIRTTPEAATPADSATPEAAPASARSATDFSGTSAGQSYYDAARDGKGFWASLGDLFIPDEDRHSYAEHAHRGGVIVSATVDAGQASTVEDILDDEGSVDMGEREESWRSQGWTGWQGQSGAPGAGYARTDVTDFNKDLDRQADQAPSAGGAAEARAEARGGTGGPRATGQESIPVVEERLNVGKRVDNSGRVRVRSYVVETPVSEQVNLRQENVSVERHPVDRAVGAGEDAFRERSLEATESSERAVVNKEARVTEEVTLNKQVENATETVTDTVRQTQVEVDDETGRQSGLAAKPGAKPGATRKPDPMGG